MTGKDDRSPVAPSTILDALPQRTARMLRRAGVCTDRDVLALTCRSLAARPAVGRKTVRAVIDVVAAQGLRLACGCGWDRSGVSSCEVTQRRVEARRELLRVAHMLSALRSPPADLARTLKVLHAAATRELPPRELEAIVAFVSPERPRVG